MDAVLIVLGILGILVGLVAIVVPVVPGSLIVWLATAGTLLLHRADALAWTLALVLAVIAVLGSLATYWLPARTGLAGTTPPSSLAAAGLGGLVGFFVLPVLGFFVGALVGLLAAERARLGDWAPAWGSVGRIARAYGLGVLVDLGAALTMATVWVLAVLLRS